MLYQLIPQITKLVKRSILLLNFTVENFKNRDSFDREAQEIQEYIFFFSFQIEVV